MQPKDPYIVVQGSSWQELMASVKIAILKGYAPQGSLVCEPISKHDIVVFVWCQAMIVEDLKAWKRENS
jgi:hypothetical protein